MFCRILEIQIVINTFACTASSVLLFKQFQSTSRGDSQNRNHPMTVAIDLHQKCIYAIPDCSDSVCPQNLIEAFLTPATVWTNFVDPKERKALGWEHRQTGGRLDRIVLLFERIVAHRRRTGGIEPIVTKLFGSGRHSDQKLIVI